MPKPMNTPCPHCGTPSKCEATRPRDGFTLRRFQCAEGHRFNMRDDQYEAPRLAENTAGSMAAQGVVLSVGRRKDLGTMPAWLHGLGRAKLSPRLV